MDTNRVFGTYYAELREVVNPGVISAPLFVEGVISENEKEDVDNMMISRHHRMDRLLSAVRRTIRVDRNSFYIFLEVLDAVEEYKPLVLRMRSDLAGEL